MIDNQQAWEKQSIAAFYALLDHLFPPEATILALLRPQLERMSMLDIGVGGGRTALHFASLAREYVGIDYSRAMVDACRKRFGGRLFHVCDVRDMGIFEDSRFDFVLFSFNGIDNLGFEDRTRALQEIRRVMKSQAVLCLSTHNLEWVEPLLPFSFHAHPRSFAREVRRILRAWRGNRARRMMLPAQRALIPHYFQGVRFDQAYVCDASQRGELVQLGAREIQLMSVWDGRVIPANQPANPLSSEPWLSYLCRF